MVLGVLVGALAFLVARFTDCGKGLGFGLGQPSAPAPSRDAPPQPEADPAPEAGGRSIAVVGSQCVLEGGEPGDCDAACRQLMAQGDPARAIEIDATKGSHGTVETLRKCLVDAGATAVEVRSE